MSSTNNSSSLVLLKELANKFGFKLVPVEIKREEPKVSTEWDKKFNNMSIEDLKTEIKEIDLNIQRLTGVSERTIKKMYDFLEEQKATNYTQGIFSNNGKVDGSRIKCNIPALNKLNEMKGRAIQILSSRQHELLEKSFKARNSDIEHTVESIEIINNEDGPKLYIRLKADLK